MRRWSALFEAAPHPGKALRQGYPLFFLSEPRESHFNASKIIYALMIPYV